MGLRAGLRYLSLNGSLPSARTASYPSPSPVASAAPGGGGGGVAVTADVGIELIAIVTAEACRELALAPGTPVVFSFKASAVRVF